MRRYRSGRTAWLPAGARLRTERCLQGGQEKEPPVFRCQQGAVRRDGTLAGGLRCPIETPHGQRARETPPHRAGPAAATRRGSDWCNAGTPSGRTADRHIVPWPGLMPSYMGGTGEHTLCEPHVAVFVGHESARASPGTETRQSPLESAHAPWGESYAQTLFFVSLDVHPGRCPALVQGRERR
jgi:hypothetical protein